MGLTSAARDLTGVLDTHREGGTTALAVFVPVGFPDLGGSVALAQRSVQAGAGVIELGVPCDQPVLDGPVISRCARAALRQGTGIPEVRTAVEQVAKAAPVVVLAYFASVVEVGMDTFARQMAQSGAAGVMIPDLPGDEALEWCALARGYGLHTPQLALRRASDVRLAELADVSSGFVYCPAADALTGYQGDLVLPAIRTFCTRVRQAGADFLASGIGLSTPARAAAVAPFVDLVVTGSSVLAPVLERPDASGADDAIGLVGQFAATVCPSPAADQGVPRRREESPSHDPELSPGVRAGQRVGARPARTLPEAPPGEPPIGT